MIAKLAPYSKFIIALAGALVIGAEAIADGQVSQTEAGVFTTALLAAFGVLWKKNAPLPDKDVNNRL